MPSQFQPAPQIIDESTEELVNEAGRLAEELFRKKKHYCTPAVLSAVNRVLGGGLDPRLIHRLTAGLVMGLHGAGCLCGAVSGGEMALGMFLAEDNPSAPRDKDLAAACRSLHDQFKAQHGSTCCRTLTKKVKDDSAAHFDHCARLSGRAAELAARLILQERPELAGGAKPVSRPRRGLLSRLGLH